MNRRTCEDIRDLLPDWILGTHPPEIAVAVEEHLTGCADCQAEDRVLRSFLASRPVPPAGLEERIKARVREDLAARATLKGEWSDPDVIPLSRWSSWTPAWALSAAAVVILSLGIGVIWNGEDLPEVEQGPVQVASEEPLPEAGLWDDGLVAGAPIYDGLTDEELEALIEELEG
jgi:hypothetical protein